MAAEPFDADAHVRHMEAVIGLTIEPDWRPGVVANVATTQRMAAQVLAFPLPGETEPAHVYEAGR